MHAAVAPLPTEVPGNDHDPKSLCYQFVAEHKDEFSWRYLDQGPQVWRVEIGLTKLARGEAR